MNYLAEILAFSEWKEVNPLPASAIALWHELMAICNKAGWIQEFTVPNGLLQAKCGLSRKEFDHARSLLINFGRIKYKKSERVNQAGKYTIVPFVQKGQQEGQQKVQQEGQREEHTRDNTGGTLYKLKQKQNLNVCVVNNAHAREEEPIEETPSLDKAKTAEIYAVIEREFGPVRSGLEADFINDLISNFPRDWIIEAIRIAVLNKARNTNYVARILSSWRDKGYSDQDKPWERERYDNRYDNRNHRRPAGNNRAGKTSPAGARPSSVDWDNEPDHL